LKDSKWIWRLVSLISIVTTIIFIVGFGYAVKDIVNPQGDLPETSLPQETSSPAEEQDGLLKVVALGDSLAKGTGDNTGSGFVKRAVQGLSSGGEKVTLLGNLGINGLTTQGLQSKLAEEGVKYTIRQANTILISIGANDLFQGSGITQRRSANPETSTEVPPIENSEQAKDIADEELSPQELLAALPAASKRLEELLLQINKINPQARIYYLGLYNPFGDIPDLLVPGNQAVTAWNNAALDIINRHSNMTLVPTFDLFHNHLEYLSTDHFHPSGEGYQRMADRVVQAVR